MSAMTTVRVGMRLLLQGLILMLLATAATACANRASPAAGVDSPSAMHTAQNVIQDLPPASGVESISVEGDTLLVTGTAKSEGADATRTLWYETVAGAAYAQEGSSSTLDRRVTDEAGKDLDAAKDAIHIGSADAFGQVTLSESDFAAGLQTRASALGVRVVSTEYFPLFGGSGEVVVQAPNGGEEFVAHAGSNVGELLGVIGQDHARPYLVTVVDENGNPLLLLAYTPNVGGDQGQGLSWIKPGVESDAIWGGAIAK